MRFFYVVIHRFKRVNAIFCDIGSSGSDASAPGTS